MADTETPVVANDAPADIKVEEPAQEKVEAQSGEALPAKEEEAVGVNQETETKPQEEEAAEVKKEAEIKDETAGPDAAAATTKTVEKKFKLNKSKFDPTVLPDSDDPEEIRKQVEFYFSDSNLSSDKFLFGLVGGKENKPVPLALIMSFKRMKRFPNKETIITALKESTVVEISGDAGEETVTRKVPLEITELVPRGQFGASGNSEWTKTIEFNPNQDPTISRSIYAKGFDAETATTQIDIEKFFEPFGPINAVRLRRADCRIFKRSVFVEFANEELAQAFMALEKKPTWGDKELLWKTKLEYVEGKIQDIKDGKVKPKNGGGHKGNQNGNQNKSNGHHNKNGNGRSGHRGGRGGRGRGGGRGGRGGHNDRRGGGDRDNRRGEGNNVKKEEHGIPKLKSSAGAAEAAPVQEGGNKRKATDEGAQEVKKPKVEGTAA